MNILLDTHIALWAIADDPKLNSSAKSYILNPDNIIFTSAATIWEIAIKHSLRKNDMPISGKQAMMYFEAAGYTMLSITPTHAVAVDVLPGHHSDPFDRILIAQTITEPLHLLTHDSKLKAYTDLVIAI